MVKFILVWILLIGLEVNIAFGYDLPGERHHRKGCHEQNGQIKCDEYSDETFRDFIQNLTNTDQISSLAIHDSSSLREIPSSVCALTKLRRLDLSHNQMRNISSVRCLTNLQEINFDGNDIQSLEDDVFSGLNKLTTVQLSNNSIAKIGKGVFTENHVNLRYVKLDHNKLKVMDTWVLLLPIFKNNADDPCSYIDLSHNEIGDIINTYHVHPDKLNTLKKCMHVNATFNQFRDFGALVKKLLVTMNIRSFLETPKLMGFYLYVDYNPFHCDCSTHNIVKRLTLLENIVGTQYLPLWSQKVECYTPLSLYGQPLFTANRTEMNCPVFVDCPDKCNCFLTPENSTLSLICAGNNMTVFPQKVPQNGSNFEFYLSNNSLVSLENIDEKLFGKITYMDLRNNQIKNATFLLQLQNIRTLLLNGNEINFLPIALKETILPNLNMLTLHGNQFMCECQTRWLIQWVNKNKAIIKPSVNGLICSNGKHKGEVISQLDEKDIDCSIDNSTTVFLASFCSFITVILLTVCVLIFKREQIRFKLLLKFQWRFLRFAYDKNKEYDVFISFCSDDIAWVKEVLVDGFLEAVKPPYTVCIHHKDFAVGLPIAENINNAVENSGCTLLIISKLYLSSEWCAYEFQQSLYYTVHNPGTRIIAILLDDYKELEPLLLMNEMKSLKNFLKSNTYVHKADDNLHKKLECSLPIPVKNIDNP